jgi:Flp pilus assembly protein TadG
MRLPYRWRLFRHDEGQVILWLAFGVPTLILFAAMAIDMGIIYQSKARLSNAVDSAVLTGAKNYSQGITTAQALATDMFQANYGSTSPTLSWVWCPSNASCTGTDLSVTLHATAPVDTTFMAYLPQWARWNIGDTGQATRSNLVMSLVLDRSGSMNDNQGAGALKAAVPIFIGLFLNGTDHIAMVSFGDNARVDVPMTTNFASSIDSAVSGLNFDGATFGTGAGTNPHDTAHGPPLNLADDQNNSVTLPAGQPETKVVVYFTDGLMNTVQDSLSCTNLSPVNTLYNFGGYDADSNCDVVSGVSRCFDFMDPTKDTYELGDLSWNYGDGSTTATGTSSAGCGPTSGKNYFCKNSVPFNASKSCKGPTKFPSQYLGSLTAFSRANITQDAGYRARYTANQLRSESPVYTYIYVIGLGQDITGDGCTEALLATMANDPAWKNYSCASYPATHDDTQPLGALLFAPDCPSSQQLCTNELTNAFRIIAAKILLRLTQ